MMRPEDLEALTSAMHRVQQLTPILTGVGLFREETERMIAGVEVFVQSLETLPPRSVAGNYPGA